MNKRSSILLSATLAALVFSPCVRAQDAAAPSATTAVEPAKPEPGAKARERVIELSKLTPEQVDQLRGKNYGWGEILIVGEMVKGGQSYDGVIADRDAGMGWGEIAKKYNLRLHALARNVHKEIKALRVEKQERKVLRELDRDLRHVEREHHRPDKARPEYS